MYVAVAVKEAHAAAVLDVSRQVSASTLYSLTVQVLGVRSTTQETG